jgi:phage/plasmid-associated DNA primase
MLEVLIGRLFYPIGKHDNWQVMPFLKGDANTGKGTVCDLVKRMFSPGSVGVITATQEGTFGLEGLYRKRLVMIPDLPKKFSKLVNQLTFNPW